MSNESAAEIYTPTWDSIRAAVERGQDLNPYTGHLQRAEWDSGFNLEELPPWSYTGHDLIKAYRSGVQTRNAWDMIRKVFERKLQETRES